METTLIISGLQNQFVDTHWRNIFKHLHASYCYIHFWLVSHAMSSCSNCNFAIRFLMIRNSKTESRPPAKFQFIGTIIIQGLDLVL